MPVGCGHKDELKYRQYKRASRKLEATKLGTMVTLVAGFTTLNYQRGRSAQFTDFKYATGTFVL